MRNTILILLIFLSFPFFLHSQNVGGVAKQVTNRGKRTIMQKIKGAINPNPKEKLIKEGKSVMGFQPSWNLYNEKGPKKLEAYDFTAMSSFILGEYDINPYTGQNRNHILTHKDYVKIAKDILDKNGSMEFYVLVTFYGDYGSSVKTAYEKLLNVQISETICPDIVNLLDTIKTTLEVEGGGIVLDFENIPEDQEENIIEFVKSIRSFPAFSGDTENNYRIILKVPSLTPGKKIWDSEQLKKIGEVVDEIIIKNTPVDYTVVAEQFPLPVKNGVINKKPYWGMDTTLTYYLSNGFSQDRIIMEIPYIAYSSNKEKPYYALEGLSKEIQPKTADTTAGILNGEKAALKGNKGFVWYDTPRSLRLKYQWLVEEKGIKGISVWNLGFAKSESKKYSESIKSVFTASAPGLLYPGLALLLLYLGGGVIWAVIGHWPVRNEVARNPKRLWYAGGAIAFVLITIMVVLWVKTIWIKWIFIALIMGVFGFFRPIMSNLRRFAK